MHGRISPRRACNPCGYTMKMSSRYHRLLIYDVKCTTKIDGMGSFNSFEKKTLYFYSTLFAYRFTQKQQIGFKFFYYFWLKADCPRLYYIHV